MADIQFQEPVYDRASSSASQRSGLAGLVIKMGLATDDAGAQKVLLIVTVMAVIATAAVIWRGSLARHQVTSIPTTDFHPEIPTTHKP